MFTAALTIPASIPTQTLSLGHEMLFALLALLCLGVAALVHAAMTAKRDEGAVAKMPARPASPSYPLGAPGRLPRPLAA